MFKKLFLATSLLIVLPGCVATPPMNFSVPDVAPVGNKIEAELKSTTVTWGRPDELVGNIPPARTNDITQTWKTALIEAINRTAIFTDDAETNVSLSVKILELDAPAAGISMETPSTARYEIIDRTDGSVIYTQDIHAKGHVSAGYAFMGPTRALESVNRSVQNNISSFLQSAQGVDPTFIE